MASGTVLGVYRGLYFNFERLVDGGGSSNIKCSSTQYCSNTEC
jgi:hypothetical protein